MEVKSSFKIPRKQERGRARKTERRGEYREQRYMGALFESSNTLGCCRGGLAGKVVGIVSIVVREKQASGSVYVK